MWRLPGIEQVPRRGAHQLKWPCLFVTLSSEQAIVDCRRKQSTFYGWLPMRWIRRFGDIPCLFRANTGVGSFTRVGDGIAGRSGAKIC
jgi:hypothetical protein